MLPAARARASRAPRKVCQSALGEARFSWAWLSSFLTESLNSHMTQRLIHGTAGETIVPGAF